MYEDRRRGYAPQKADPQAEVPVVGPFCECGEEGDLSPHQWVRNGPGVLVFDVWCNACGVEGKSVVTLKEAN